MIERRTIAFDGESMELRGRAVSGVAMPYGEEARIGKFRERFLAGSLRAHPDALANLFHSEARILARNGKGLEFRDTPGALRAVVNLPRTAEGDDALELLRTEVIRGFSVEFRAEREDWTGNLRTVARALLTGLALVPNPAYAGAVTEELRQRQLLARPQAGRAQIWPLL